ncbi:MAG: hypothetical protein HN909_02930 [Phycisphaerales bacterium]|jgi:protein tyrosine phosphatase (PTP) superfamily phosphohydrolase (DUF442 family)|nr:hypothetical protein [Phycisphaerales bacterium]MBT7170706.1 hypothetical protein [Phycisphaerales bacterium]
MAESNKSQSRGIILFLLALALGGGSVWCYHALKGKPPTASTGYPVVKIPPASVTPPANPAPNDPPATPKTMTVHIENFVKVDDGLYRGAQPDQAGYDDLRALGIRTIACLRVSDDHCETPQFMAFRTHHISFKHTHPEDEDVRKWLAILKDKTSRPIYVHCRQGVDRTGMMVAIYRIVVQDWTVEAAIEEMKTRGFNKWNITIERYLKKLDVAKFKAYLAE